jgi:TetR/AcrR family transcriptional regulator of autoinduction and epiphytic fitness
MKNAPVKKKTRNKSRKHNAILNAAAQAFINEGYEKASMDRIAEIAGASKRTVYNHFASKEELFQAVTDRFVKEQQGLNQIQYDPARGLEDQLFEFVEAELFFINDPIRLGLSKVLTSVFLFDTKLAVETRAKYPDAEGGLIEWLRAANKDGKLAVPDPELAARIFYAMIQGALTWPALFQGPLRLQAVEPLIEELIATFLSRYRKQP